MLYVIDSLGAGGAETSLAAMSGYFRDHGVQLDVAYFKEIPGVHEQLRRGGATLIPLRVPADRSPDRRFATLFPALRLSGGRLSRAMVIRRLVSERRPDLVHTTLFEADIAGRIGAVLARTPVVSSLVNTPYGKEHRAGVPSALKLRLAHALDATTAQVVRRFHANSHDTAAVMGRRLLVRSSKIDVVHRGRSAAELGRRDPARRTRVRASLEIDEATPVVLAVARQDHAKGLDLLIRSVTKLRVAHPDLVVLIAGRPGNHTAELSRLLAGLPAQDFAAVRMLGHRPDVADLLAAADVLAFPSRKEGLPGTLIEALALECPIVATDLPAIGEVVGGDLMARSALLVPPDDAEALGEAIHLVLAGVALREQLVATARHRFESQFTIERSAEGMLAFYDRALSGGHRNG